MILVIVNTIWMQELLNILNVFLITQDKYRDALIQKCNRGVHEVYHLYNTSYIVHAGDLVLTWVVPTVDVHNQMM